MRKMVNNALLKTASTSRKQSKKFNVKNFLFSIQNFSESAVVGSRKRRYPEPGIASQPRIRNGGLCTCRLPGKNGNILFSDSFLTRDGILERHF
jgi:hypothetical protein